MLRLWPGVVLVALQWLVRFAIPALWPQAGGGAIIGGVVGGLLVIVWWLFFSRAPWIDRVGALLLMVAAVVATRTIVHPSVSNGMMGMMLPIFSVPFLCLALVISAALGSRLPPLQRRLAMAVALFLSCGVLALVRTGGITGDADADLHWRWTKTPEERLLAEGSHEPLAPAATAPDAAALPENRSAASPAITTVPPVATGSLPAEAPPVTPLEARWSGFRGSHRDGVVRGVRIETDWSAKPPVALWRRPVGPGWSSFAVDSNVIYTQEQRGDEEIVAAYDVATGKPVWRHSDAARFWESNAGAGPRGTPTIAGTRLFSIGATGILNALDARSGRALWSHNVASDTGKKIPDWGIASSPLVVGDLVVAAASGFLAAYDAANGTVRWFGPKSGGGYSSPQLATLGGVPQVVFHSSNGAIGVALSDGSVLWEHAWPSDGIVQPAIVGSDVLIGSGSGLAEHSGVVRLQVAHGPSGWTVTERWSSAGLKPYFNDFVVHNGHAFGFDGSILACIDLEDGTRKWKGGRYGHGQIILLPDQNLLLVLSEEGELALVRATADKFTEVARVPALEGKTWNHPVLVGDLLLVRNGEQMAAFRLPLANR